MEYNKTDLPTFLVPRILILNMSYQMILKMISTDFSLSGLVYEIEKNHCHRFIFTYIVVFYVIFFREIVLG